MKKFLLILLNFSWALFSQAQQIIDLHTGQLAEQSSSTIPLRDIEELQDGYLVTYSFEKALILPDELFPGTLFWKMDGFGMNQTPGAPCTLAHNDLFAIPYGHNAKVEIIDSIYRDFDYELTPARQPLLDSNSEIYTKQNVWPIKPFDGFYPTTIVSNTSTQSYRGHSICQITVSPIQYNYNTKTIRAYSSIIFKVSFFPNHADTIAKKNAPLCLGNEDNFLANCIVDCELNKKPSSNTISTAQADVRDYLILSTNTFSAAANRFAEWKCLMGFNTHVILRDDWTSTSIKDTVYEAYSNLPALYYLLIIGDHSDVPAQQSSLYQTHITDFHYGCMDGDFLPDIFCGRLSVSSSEEAINVVEKIISYEQTPPTSPTFYNNGLHCAYFQDNNHDNYADRRFAQTSEDVRTYVMSHGKSLERVYTTPSSVTPLYWNKTIYSYGEAIPNELKKPEFAWNGNYNNINDAINSGVFYILHRDHGAVWGWGDPSYTQQNISDLTNGELLPVVFSMNCLTGKFDEDCFAETFLRKPNGGCVAIYGASKESFSGYNDALITGMFDAIWPTPGLRINIPNHNNSFSITPTPTYTLGQILAQGLVRLAETYGLTSDNTRYTKELFHCFGDPSLKIYTELPTAFTDVSITRDSNSISISLGANDLARITTYTPITGDVQSYLGSSAIITTSYPNETIVCVSGHNRIPFIQKPDIMYIQNTNITGTLNEEHDVIKMGNHVTTTIETGDVTTSNANITLRAKEVFLDGGTHISVGSTLTTINP